MWRHAQSSFPHQGGLMLLGLVKMGGCGRGQKEPIWGSTACFLCCCCLGGDRGWCRPRCCGACGRIDRTSSFLVQHNVTEVSWYAESSEIVPERGNKIIIRRRACKKRNTDLDTESKIVGSEYSKPIFFQQGRQQCMWPAAGDYWTCSWHSSSMAATPWWQMGLVEWPFIVLPSLAHCKITLMSHAHGLHVTHWFTLSSTYVLQFDGSNALLNVIDWLTFFYFFYDQVVSAISGRSLWG